MVDVEGNILKCLDCSKVFGDMVEADLYQSLPELQRIRSHITLTTIGMYGFQGIIEPSLTC